MFPDLLDFANRSAMSLAEVARDMALPAFFFFLLGLAVKGRTLFTDMRRAMAESSLNLQILVFNLLLIVPLLTLLGQAVSETVAAHHLWLINPSVWESMPRWLVIAVAIFLGDFIGYWRHRLEHTPILWPSHAVHHSDTELTWLSLERFHPINRLTTFFIDTSLLILLGIPPFAFIASNLWRHYYGYFVHADLPWTFGPLGRIFVSPAMHRWHHAAHRDYFNSNYATVFSLFDWAFGTFKLPGPCTSPLGVTDDMAPTLSGQMAYAFTPRAYRRLFRRRS